MPALIAINTAMSEYVVQSKVSVTLVGSGESSPEIVKEALTIAPFLVAADGGANMAVLAGFLPEIVIGDMDSVTPQTLDAIPQARIWRINEQDSTDFEKCLSRIAAPFILAVGFTGARIDHLLSVFTVLVRYPHCRCLVLGSDDVIFLAPRQLVLDVEPGTRVSLFPMGPVQGRSVGLFWPIDGIEFAPDGRVGTSNRATGPVTLEFTADRMLVALPRACLEAAIAALTQQPRL